MNPEIPVGAIMSRDVICIPPYTTLSEVRRIFESKQIHHLPVTFNGKLVGIIAKSDFSRLFHPAFKSEDVGDPSDQYTAEDVMTTDVLHVESHDTIGLAADIFLANTFHALPVLEDYELVGIITSHDLLKYAFESVSLISE